MINWLRFKYSWAPFLSALVWAATLISLFVLWLVDGPPYYKQNRTILLISYAGAKWKGLFVPGAVVTAILYVITLILDVELRRHERIPAFLQRRESVYAVLSIITGIIGAVGLSLLAILDVRNHNSAHWVSTVVFIIAVFLNGVFNLLEIKHLSRGHFQLGYLRRNAIAKLVIASVALVFAIAFLGLQASCDDNRDDPFDRSCNVTDSTAAVFEWLIAVLFCGFLITYAVDFRAIEQPPAELREIEAQEQIQDVNQAQQMGDLQQVVQMPKPEEQAAQASQIGSGVA